MGKGSKSRVSNHDVYRKNHDAIFSRSVKKQCNAMEELRKTLISTSDAAAAFGRAFGVVADKKRTTTTEAR